MWAMGEPIGPMLNGTTYIVRPRIDPSKRPRRVSFISLGWTQLLVGPASFLFRLHINVRSSTRATSLGFDLARKLLGRRAWFKRMKVPGCTICSHRASYSSCEPSHQCTRSGRHSFSIWSTQLRSFTFPTSLRVSITNLLRFSWDYDSRFLGRA